MTLDARNIQLPRQGRGSALLLRFTILILDLIALICLCVNLGLYHKWVARSKHALTDLVIADPTNRAYYYRDRDIITYYRYWQDPVVIVLVIWSLTYTAYIYLRPAWTQKPFHQIAQMVSESLLCIFILGCSIPAFVLSPIQRPDSLGLRVEGDGYYIYRPEGTVYYSTEHKLPQKGLQVVAFALVWAVAYVVHPRSFGEYVTSEFSADQMMMMCVYRFFHLCLSCIAVSEHRNRAVDSGVKDEAASSNSGGEVTV